jgi:hypothetical protein
MNRRNFVAGAATGAALSTSAMSETAKPSILELRYLYLRNGSENQGQRMADWLIQKVKPALEKNGIGPVGVFRAAIGPNTPYLMVLLSHASMAAVGQDWAKMEADAEFQRDFQSFYSMPGRPYERMEVQLLEAFAGFPGIEVPPSEASRPARIFELRTYESTTPVTLAKKIGMFESGEVGLFRKFKLAPVFFGRTIVGPRMPNLTYMVGFDNFAAREESWRAFGTSPEWQKMRSTPGLGDGDIVSNISNVILTPVNGSAIR